MTYPVAYAPPPVYAPPMIVAPRRSAPPSVHVIAILQYLGGVAALATAALVGYFAFLAGSEPAHADDFIDPETFAVMLGIAAGVFALSGLAALVLGRKLQRGRQWARVIVLMLSVLGILSAVGSVALDPQNNVWNAAGALYPLLCIALLNTRAARSWFRWQTW